MYSSQKSKAPTIEAQQSASQLPKSLQPKKDIVLSIFQDTRTVFKPCSVAALTHQSDAVSLYKRLNYYVRTGKLQNPQKGIYAKPNYNIEELANMLYAPSYESFETVLQKAGVTFQYYERIFFASYLSRSVEVDGRTIQYRKIKSEILVNPAGIYCKDNVTYATPERALLDILYLDPNYHFDNLRPIDKEKVMKIAPIYCSKTLTDRVAKLFENA